MSKKTSGRVSLSCMRVFIICLREVERSFPAAANLLRKKWGCILNNGCRIFNNIYGIRNFLFAQQHRHDEHEQIFILHLGGRNNDAGAAGIGHLDYNLVGLGVVQHFGEESSVEADAERCSVVFAKQCFFR